MEGVAYYEIGRTHYDKNVSIDDSLSRVRLKVAGAGVKVEVSNDRSVFHTKVRIFDVSWCYVLWSSHSQHKIQLEADCKVNS